MNKRTTLRDREPFSRSKDGSYKFLGNPLLRKADDKTLTKRNRDGASPGKHGVKAPPPPNVTGARAPDRSKYMPHQGKQECARRLARGVSTT